MKNKIKSKFMILVLVATMCMSSFFANFTMNNVKADANDIKDVNGDKITVSDFGDDVVYQGVTDGSVRYKVNLGGKVEFPTITVNGTEIDFNAEQFVVTDSNNVKVELTTKDGQGNDIEKPYFFASQRGGYYKIAIKPANSSQDKVATVVSNIRIDVESKDFNIVYPNNSQFVIPGQIPANWTETSGNRLRIAVPTVFDDDKEVDFDENKELSLVVEVKKPNGEPVVLTKDTSGAFYEFAIPAEVGMYRVVFKLTAKDGDAGEVTLDSTSQEFEVVKSLDVKSIQIKGDANSSNPTTAEIGEVVNLPTYKYYNGTNDKDLKAYTDITITCYPSDGSEKIDYSEYVEDFKFTPLHKGDYKITYTAKIDLFSTDDYKCEKKITTFTLEDVDCTKEPEIKTSYGYELNQTGDFAGYVSKIYTSFDYLTVGEAAADYILVDYAKDATSGLITEIRSTTYKDNAKVDDSEVSYKDLLQKDATFNNYSVQRYVDGLVVDALVDTLSVAKLESHTIGETSETENYVEVVIPAIYAMDNYSKINEITFTRRIKDGTPTYDIKNSDGSIVPANLAGVYKFTSTGDKLIQTTATNLDSEAESKSYAISIKPVDAFGNIGLDENPTVINMDSLSSSKTRTDVITFSVPTVTDKNDTRMELHTYYQLFKGETNVGDAVELTSENVNKNGKYEIDINDFVGLDFDTIRITVKAYNDYYKIVGDGLQAKEAFDKTNPSAEKIVNVKILDNTETKPATIEIVTENSKTTFNDILADKNGVTETIGNDGYTNSADKVAPFNQTVKNSDPTIIKLPSFKVTDENRASLSVTIIDENGREIPFVDDYSYIKTGETATGNEYTLSGATFNAKYSGMYTINYTLVDLAGNITTTSYALRVNDKAAPTSFVLDENAFSKNLEVGQYFEVPNAGLIDNGIEIDVEEDYEVSGSTYTYWIVKGKDGAKLDTDGQTGFTPKTAGTFELTYYGADEAGNKLQKTYTLVAEDTIKPVITVTDTDYKSVYDWDVNGVTITVPNATVTDLNLSSDQDTLATVTVTNEDNSSVSTTNEDGVITFKATSQGIYTIKYSATDKYGNVANAPSPIKIYVGDYTNPEIEWEDMEESVPATVNKGGKLTISEDAFKLFDIDYDGEEATKGVKECKFILQDPNSKKVTIQYIKNGEFTGNKLDWTLSSVGEYQLTVYIEDENGRDVTTSAYKITVPSEEQKESKDVQPVVGTILIVASVLILAGVVTYFIVSSRVLSKKSTKTAKESKKDNDKIVK